MTCHAMPCHGVDLEHYSASRVRGVVAWWRIGAHGVRKTNPKTAAKHGLHAVVSTAAFSWHGMRTLASVAWYGLRGHARSMVPR